MGKIYLIGWGEVEGRPAENIKAGDTLMWNYGLKSEVLSIDKVTPKSITITTKVCNGKEYKRILRKSTLVCIL